MGEVSSKQKETLEDYRPDQKMERVQSQDSTHHAQRLNIKENLIHQVTNEKGAQEEGGSSQGGNQHIKLDAAQRKTEENVTASVGYQEGVLGRYDWREDLGWNEKQDSFVFVSHASKAGSQEDSLLPMQVCNMRPWKVQRQSQPVQFQKS